jgi:hypothetical protein
MMKLKTCTAGSGPMILSAIVATTMFVVVACSKSSSPVAPSAGPAASGSQFVQAPSFPYPGQSCVPGGVKDETPGGTQTLAGVNTVYIKAGRNCYGPITTSGLYGPTATANCWSVTFSGGGVTVTDLGGPGCQGAGLSHIDGVTTATPTPTPTPTPEPTPEPTPTPTPTPTPAP